MNRLALPMVLIACLSLSSFTADAQSGPRGGRGGGGQGGDRQQQQPRSEPRSQTAPVTDPIAALERELPSLRLDLKLEREQTALFDSFTRAVRDAGEAGRARVKQLYAFKFDDGSTVSAASIVQTVSEADQARASAMRAVVEKLDAVYSTFNADQRRLFDRRVMQSQREPLGNS